MLSAGLRFPEGPAFDASNRLWCVEQEGESLYCRDADGTEKRIKTGGRPNGAVAQGDYIWFCDSGQNAIRRIHCQTEQLETMVTAVNGKPLDMPNDLCFDRWGNLLFTCPGPSDTKHAGYVAVCTPEGFVDIVADNLLYPNGLTFLPDGRTLLIAETHQQRIWQGYWDEESLSWENIRVWTTVIDAPADATTPGPDGMTIDADGCLYVAVFGAGIIRVFTGEGEFSRDIKLPGQNPTNCIFDPSGRLGLIVTEAERGELLSIRL